MCSTPAPLLSVSLTVRSKPVKAMNARGRALLNEPGSGFDRLDHMAPSNNAGPCSFSALCPIEESTSGTILSFFNWSKGLNSYDLDSVACIRPDFWPRPLGPTWVEKVQRKVER